MAELVNESVDNRTVYTDKQKVELSDFELDALKEIANIGVGNASIALSALLNQKVNLGLPVTAIVSVESVASHIASDGESMIGLFSRVKEGMEGNILLVMSSQSALSLIGQFSDNKEEKNNLNTTDMIMFKKIGSVIYSTYLTSLAKFFEQRITFQTPSIMSAFGKSMVDFLLVQVGEKEKVLLITMNFKIDDLAVKGNFVLLFTLSSLYPLLSRLNRKMGELK